MNCICTTSIKT
uniref:Uncharacterized protein n=1 Tax=Anguilla anguilla TaxID=7936 RepID=A0A0E9W087_ANGAN